MKDSESLVFTKPFKGLKFLLKEQKVLLDKTDQHKKKPTTQPVETPVEKDDETLFLEAMTDVKPISGKNLKTDKKTSEKPSSNNTGATDDDKEVQRHLSKLVRNGIGFEVSSTPEYMEGTNYNVHPEITKRLHKGAFSIQDHVDLHGMTVPEAENAFNELFKKATATGLRGLLIIHGRGLSSPGKPILKGKVHEWLTYGPWRKWVIAFSSARACDGGAGATYVLLRKNPLTKRHRKKHLKRPNIY